MKDIKESNNVDVAKYATARGVKDKPAFSWWVTHTFRKLDAIMAEVSLGVRNFSHSYVIELPISVAKVRLIDQKNGNTFWVDEIQK